MTKEEWEASDDARALLLHLLDGKELEDAQIDIQRCLLLMGFTGAQRRLSGIIDRVEKLKETVRTTDGSVDLDTLLDGESRELQAVLDAVDPDKLVTASLVREFAKFPE